MVTVSVDTCHIMSFAALHICGAVVLQVEGHMTCCTTVKLMVLLRNLPQWLPCTLLLLKLITTVQVRPQAPHQHDDGPDQACCGGHHRRGQHHRRDVCA